MVFAKKPKTAVSTDQQQAKKEATKATKEPDQGFSILLPKSMHKQLKLMALERETTVSALIREAVQQQYFEQEG